MTTKEIWKELMDNEEENIDFLYLLPKQIVWKYNLTDFKKLVNKLFYSRQSKFLVEGLMLEMATYEYYEYCSILKLWLTDHSIEYLY